ncbi:MAG: DedA family protein [Bacteroidota bacterium]|nr:DedA family protein [Bacteroidota bacterium]
METIHSFIDFVLHLDKSLPQLVSDYHNWAYLILFLIIFCETGLVVTPFLPGDSLIFAAGAVAASQGHPLQLHFLLILLILAAFSGDNTNFFIGRFLGHAVYEKNYKLINRKNLDKTHAFYERHGGKTLILARYMPIIRTFAPFVAGVGQMKYKRFYLFSLAANILWVNCFCWAGYLFGNIEFVQHNFSVVILAIILISLIPPVLAVIKQQFAKNNES